MAESAERTSAQDPHDRGAGEGAVAPPPAEARPPDSPRAADPPPPPPRKPHRRSWLRRTGAYVMDVGRGVYRKGAQDEIFFLAGAISFNVLVAFIPLLITVVGIAGVVLGRLGADAQQALLVYLDQTIPQAVSAGERGLDVERILDDLAVQGAGLLSIGALFFLWVATRLVGTLRVVLRDIFDLPESRGIIAGKIFDVKMLIAAGTLFALNVALTLGLRLSASFVAEELHIDPGEIPFMGQATRLWPQIVAFVTIWIMFFLIYRYLPPRRIKASTAVTAATFTAVLGEALKYSFSWYVTNVARYSAWGTIATFIVLVIWLYYTAVVFVLGGEVAQVIAMHRIRRRQKQRLA